MDHKITGKLKSLAAQPIDRRHNNLAKDITKGCHLN